MADTVAPFRYLDEAAIAAAELRTDPYDYAYVDQAMPVAAKAEVLADAPKIPHKGTYGIPTSSTARISTRCSRTC